MTTQAQVISVKKASQMDLLKKKNVTGVGVGYKVRGGQVTDELCLVTLVRRKVAVAELSAQDLVPKDIQGVVTDVLEVGEIVAHKARTDRWRPAPPGVSIGHYNITAGTFGAVVRDVTTNKRLILSNNHVLANSNNASKGDAILQPGAADGGRNPQDRIGSLERFVKINMEGGSDDGGSTCSVANFMAALLNLAAKMVGSKSRLATYRTAQSSGAAQLNRVDAAVATPMSDDAISDEIIDIGRVTKTREAELNMSVKKSGRTTSTTSGQITTINAMVEVGYGGSLVARFEDQIVTTNISQPGDSGSLLVTPDGSGYAAVGLLFAGSDQVTIHCPIQAVMELLNVDFDLDRIK